MQKENVKIEAIRKFFMQCPLLKNGALNIDHLDSDAINYSINSDINSNLVIKRYRDGGELRQFLFTFMSTEIRSQDIVDQIQAMGFYEQLEDWIELQNKINNLPDIEGIQSIEIMSPAFLWDASESVSYYQIQLRITYLKEVI